MKNETKIEQAVERVASARPCPNVRTLRRVEVGTVAAQQGDVYLHVVKSDHPRGKAWGSRQVAIGTTQGSRHVAEGEGVEVFQGAKLPTYMTRPAWCRSDEQFRQIVLGPVIEAPNGLTLTHPEHAHHRLPAGTYQVTYQMDSRARARAED